MTLSTEITRWLAQHEDAMIALLRDLVNTDSGTYDKAGVDQAGAVLQQFWRSHNLAVTTHPQPDLRGRHQRPSPGTQRRFGAADPAARPSRYRVPQGRADTASLHHRSGPCLWSGVADMKSGLVIEAFVMAGFAALGGARRP